MFADGNGVRWLGKPDLLFLCTPTSRPIHGPQTETTRAQLGTWHAGKRTGDRPILEIDFCRHDLDLPAGLLLSTDWAR